MQLDYTLQKSACTFEHAHTCDPGRLNAHRALCQPSLNAMPDVASMSDFPAVSMPSCCKWPDTVYRCLQIRCEAQIGLYAAVLCCRLLIPALLANSTSLCIANYLQAQGLMRPG